MDFFHSPVAFFIISSVVAVVGAYIRNINSKVDKMVTEQHVRELIADKMDVVGANYEAVKTRTERVEDSLIRIEEKLDALITSLARRK